MMVCDYFAALVAPFKISSGGEGGSPGICGFSLAFSIIKGVQELQNEKAQIKMFKTPIFQWCVHRALQDCKNPDKRENSLFLVNCLVADQQLDYLVILS